uniref:Uncharacterized protein n=1 Tax=Pararge aegeria TaxID=116150 RepID=S4PV56_9NEOP
MLTDRCEISFDALRFEKFALGKDQMLCWEGIPGRRYRKIRILLNIKGITRRLKYKCIHTKIKRQVRTGTARLSLHGFFTSLPGFPQPASVICLDTNPYLRSHAYIHY